MSSGDRLRLRSKSGFGTVTPIPLMGPSGTLYGIPQNLTLRG